MDNWKTILHSHHPSIAHPCTYTYAWLRGSHLDTYTNTFIYIYKYTYYRDLYSCPLLLDTYHTVMALNSYNWLITSWNITLVAGVIIPFITVEGHNCIYIYSIPIFRCKTCIHCVPHSVLVLGWSGWSSCSWCSGPGMLSIETNHSNTILPIKVTHNNNRYKYTLYYQEMETTRTY